MVAAPQRSLLLLLFVLIIIRFVAVVVCSVSCFGAVVIDSGVFCRFAFEGFAVQFETFAFA